MQRNRGEPGREEGVRWLGREGVRQASPVTPERCPSCVPNVEAGGCSVLALAYNDYSGMRAASVARAYAHLGEFYGA